LDDSDEIDAAVLYNLKGIVVHMG